MPVVMLRGRVPLAFLVGRPQLILSEPRHLLWVHRILRRLVGCPLEIRYAMRRNECKRVPGVFGATIGRETVSFDPSLTASVARLPPGELSCFPEADRPISPIAPSTLVDAEPTAGLDDRS